METITVEDSPLAVYLEGICKDYKYLRQQLMCIGEGEHEGREEDEAHPTPPHLQVSAKSLRSSPSFAPRGRPKVRRLKTRQNLPPRLTLDIPSYPAVNVIQDKCCVSKQFCWMPQRLTEAFAESLERDFGTGGERKVPGTIQIPHSSIATAQYSFLWPSRPSPISIGRDVLYDITRKGSFHLEGSKYYCALRVHLGWEPPLDPRKGGFSVRHKPCFHSVIYNGGRVLAVDCICSKAVASIFTAANGARDFEFLITVTGF